MIHFFMSIPTHPPIGNVTPYFRGLVPYAGKGQLRKGTKQVRKGTQVGNERHKKGRQ